MALKLNSPVIITKRNVDRNNNPISVRLTERKQVIDIHNCIPTDQTIDKSARVTIAGMTEVYNMDEITATTYFVDYEQGVLHFHHSQVGKTIEYSYMGIGYVAISARRVFTEVDGTNGNIVKYLDESIAENISLRQRVEEFINNGASSVDVVLEEARKRVGAMIAQANADIQKFMTTASDNMTALVDKFTATVNERYAALHKKIDELSDRANSIMSNFAQFESNATSDEITRKNNEIVRRRNERIRQENELKRAKQDTILNNLITAAGQTNISATIEAEVVAARSTDANLNARLDRMEARSKSFDLEVGHWHENKNMYANIGMTVYTANITHNIDGGKITSVEFYSEATGRKQLITHSKVSDIAIQMVIDEPIAGTVIITVNG